MGRPKKTDTPTGEVSSTTEEPFNLKNIVKALKSEYPTSRIAGSVVDPTDKVSTGNKALDLSLNGGFTIGYAAEVSGLSGSGKTTLLQLVLANMQEKYNAIGVWVDREKAWFNDRSAQLGINLDRVIPVDPLDVPSIPDASKFIELTLAKIPSTEYKFIAIDSISAFMKTGKVDKEDMGRKARQLHELFRSVLSKVDSRTLFMFTNQVTYKTGITFGDPRTTTGGEAPKYYTTYRLQLMDKRQILDPSRNNEVLGNWVEATISKTRRGPNHRTVSFPLLYADSMPFFGGYARLLCDRGYLTPKNKKDFNSFKQNIVKYNDEELSEHEIESFLSKYPSLDFSEYPEFNVISETETSAVLESDE